MGSPTRSPEKAIAAILFRIRFPEISIRAADIGSEDNSLSPPVPRASVTSRSCRTDLLQTPTIPQI